jgi:ABC-type multidrug transport system ATPase subunit
MKLSFRKTHKSILSFPDIELPNFVVLTGVNGAGKSHLLEAIENGSMQVDDILIDQTRPIRRFDWTNLIPQDTGAFAPYQINQERYGLWNELSQHIKVYRSQISQTLQQLNQFDLDKLSMDEIVNLTSEKLIEKGNTPEEANQVTQTIQNITQNANQNATNAFINNDPINRSRLIGLFQNSTKKPLIAFGEDDFYDYFPRSWQPIDMFQQSFSRLFADYQNNWLKNRIKYTANQDGEPVIFLNDKEFLEKYGEPPWDFVNSILEIANLDFRINQPPKYDDRAYEPILTDRSRNSQVKFNDLSSGERILMSFALCLYYAGDRRQIVDYPKILLFDEIDAPLHPSMTQSLLRTIQDVLVNRHGIKVILTTHSPSTVALSPEESLYAMYKNDQKRIQKTSKDKALSILTNGVPTLSIDYENRRQVFVESHYDVKYYERLYEKCRGYLIPEVSLNFIASGVGGKGNCDQVREVVNQLQTSGNRTVYGIIDWDLTNFGNKRVKILGKEKRYNIENYILDPILIAAFVLREKLIEKSSIELEEHENYTNLGKFDNVRLQKISDFIVKKFQTEILSATEKTQKADDYLKIIIKVRTLIESLSESAPTSCQYLGNQVIDIPKWFLHIQGHELEIILKEIFRELKRFQNESVLKLEIISKVIDDIPSLIPYDFIVLFKEIQDIESE